MISKEHLDILRTGFAPFNPQLRTLLGEIDRLTAAIQNHFDQTTGHSMCWKNDEELWRTIGIQSPYPHESMATKKEMLKHCGRYIDSRIQGTPYVEATVKEKLVKKKRKKRKKKT